MELRKSTTCSTVCLCVCPVLLTACSCSHSYFRIHLVDNKKTKQSSHKREKESEQTKTKTHTDTCTSSIGSKCTQTHTHKTRNEFVCIIYRFLPPPSLTEKITREQNFQIQRPCVHLNVIFIVLWSSWVVSRTTKPRENTWC